MELLSGGTLGAWVRASPRSVDEVLARFVAAGRGLAAAHAEGVVHRDFKPENVLLGPGDRVCVTDFGLARAQERPNDGREPSRDDLEGSGESLERLTRTGAFVGTPAYMSPEQLSGVAADPRSDQFSFCVALWRALYGERPFGGETLRELVAAVVGGQLREPPANASVSAPIARALRRGLAVDPAKRWPDMNGLLAVLARDRAGARGRMTMVAVALGLVGVATWGAARSVETRPCTGAEQHLAGAWDERRRDDVERALLATSLPFAAAAVEGVRAQLDAYAEAWTTMHAEACEATTVRGEQSAALLDVRMACLDRRRGELTALVDVLADADAAVAEQAVYAASRLVPLDRCADADALLADRQLPADPELAARVDALAGTLRELVAQASAGRAVAALPDFDALVVDAEQVGWGPLVAEARNRRGRARAIVGNYEGAVEDMNAAYELALAHGLDEIAAEAARELAFVIGYKQSQHDEGLRWIRHALPLALRAGRDDLLEANARARWGVLLLHRAELEDAERETTLARAIFERKLGPDHIEVAEVLTRLGDIATAGQRYDPAEAYYRDAIAIFERKLGPDHPYLTPPLANLGAVNLQRLRHEEAAGYLARALAIQEASLGDRHPDLVTTLTNLGNVALAREDWAGARARFERARDIAVASFGEDSSQVGVALVNLGTALHRLGDLDGARAALDRTLELWQRDLGRDHVALGYPLTGLGSVLTDLDRAAEAVPLLERALALRVGGPASVAELADTRFALARALWATRADRQRASELAEQARAGYVGLGPEAGHDLRELEAWLAERASE
jgi:tetratricopeptide (TPR) repeat protein